MVDSQGVKEVSPALLSHCILGEVISAGLSKLRAGVSSVLWHDSPCILGSFLVQGALTPQMFTL